MTSDSETATVQKPKKATIETLKRYDRLKTEKDKIEDRLKTINAELEKLDQAVLTYFQDHGLQNTTVGKRVYYMRRELWLSKAEDVSYESLVPVFKKLGIDDLIAPRINAQTFSAWGRAREKQMKDEGKIPNSVEDILPEELRGKVKVSEVFKIGSRKK